VFLLNEGFQRAAVEHLNVGGHDGAPQPVVERRPVDVGEHQVGHLEDLAVPVVVAKADLSRLDPYVTRYPSVPLDRQPGGAMQHASATLVAR
jgi:hypothetical protein